MFWFNNWLLFKLFIGFRVIYLVIYLYVSIFIYVLINDNNLEIISKKKLSLFQPNHSDLLFLQYSNPSSNILEFSNLYFNTVYVAQQFSPLLP